MTDRTTNDSLDRWQRVRHVALGALALTVALLGLAAIVAPGFVPLPWALAPLHSRCIGAMQLGLALALWRAWRSRDPALAHAPMRALALACAGSALALLRNAGAESVPHAAAWIIGYIAVALLAEALTRAAHELQAPAERPDRGWLALAALSALVAAALLLAPAALASHWPWRMNPAQAVAYVGPFAALAMLASAVARDRRRYVRHAVLPALLAISIGVLAASSWHFAAFSAGLASRRPGGYAWFVAFALLAVLAGHPLRRR